MQDNMKAENGKSAEESSQRQRPNKCEVQGFTSRLYCHSRFVRSKYPPPPTPEMQGGVVTSGNGDLGEP